MPVPDSKSPAGRLHNPIQIPIFTGMISRSLLVVLLIVNAIVLLGQIWPDGAPPFARAVNIVFLACTLLVFAFLLRRGARSR